MLAQVALGLRHLLDNRSDTRDRLGLSFLRQVLLLEVGSFSIKHDRLVPISTLGYLSPRARTNCEKVGLRIEPTVRHQLLLGFRGSLKAISYGSQLGGREVHRVELLKPVLLLDIGSRVVLLICFNDERRACLLRRVVSLQSKFFFFLVIFGGRFGSSQLELRLLGRKDLA